MRRMLVERSRRLDRVGKARLIYCVIFAAAAAGCAQSPHTIARRSGPPESKGAQGAESPALHDSDTTATTFLDALREGDYQRAAKKFDARVKSGLPVTRLTDVWSKQVRSLGAPGSWMLVDRSEADGMDVRVALLGFQRGALLATIAIQPETQEIGGLWFKPAPHELVEALAQADARQKAEQTKAPPPSAASFRAEELEVGQEPFLLKGTLTLPLDQGRRFPAVILVHGSGPQDRDESVGPNKPFKDVAEGLASQGIAVLRYEKRTQQYRAKLRNDISLDEEVIVDAIAALALLRGRPDIDPRHLFVVGHSLGALLTPEIARRAQPVAGIVLLAPPGRPPWDILLEQLRYLQTPPEQLAKVEAEVAQLKEGAEGQTLGVPNTYWRDLASRDGVGTAKKLGKPILIVRGDRDYQVTSADLEVWRAGLNGVAGVEILTIPGDNHLFMKGAQGKPGPSEYFQPGHVDPALLQKLVEFVKQRSS